MLKLLDYLEQFNEASIALRLVLATILGGLIGVEREAKRHPAGFRTFVLVCLGSCLGTIANLYLFYDTGSADTSRIPASIVSGIGFLGVGTIIVTGKNRVKGLTTAAALWTTSALGIALGAGMIKMSVFAFALVFVTLGVLNKISAHIADFNPRISIYIELTKSEIANQVLDYMTQKGYKLVSMKKKHLSGDECEISLTVDFDLLKKIDHSVIKCDIMNLEGVRYVEEL